MDDQLIFEVFGRKVAIMPTGGRWLAFYVDNGGRYQSAFDIRIPANLTEAELPQYLVNLYPPEARAEGGGVHRIQ